MKHRKYVVLFLGMHVKSNCVYDEYIDITIVKS